MTRAGFTPQDAALRLRDHASLKVYVWTDILEDWTSGSAVVVAPNLRTARALLRKALPEFHQHEADNKPAHIYSAEVARVANVTWGGA